MLATKSVSGIIINIAYVTQNKIAMVFRGIEFNSAFKMLEKRLNIIPAVGLYSDYVSGGESYPLLNAFFNSKEMDAINRGIITHVNDIPINWIVRNTDPSIKHSYLRLAQYKHNGKYILTLANSKFNFYNIPSFNHLGVNELLSHIYENPTSEEEVPSIIISNGTGGHVKLSYEVKVSEDDSGPARLVIYPPKFISQGYIAQENTVVRDIKGIVLGEDAKAISIPLNQRPEKIHQDVMEAINIQIKLASEPKIKPFNTRFNNNLNAEVEPVNR